MMNLITLLYSCTLALTYLGFMILNSFFFDFDLDSMDIMMTKEA